MNQTYDCNIILDLLPLLSDGMTSEETTTLIHAHLENCPVCKQVYDEMSQTLPMAAPAKKKKRARKFRRKSRLRILLLAYVLLLLLINAFCLLDIILF